MNCKVLIQVDSRFRLGDVFGSGSYAVVYHAWNIIKDDAVTIKLESITAQPSSIKHKYAILKRLEGIQLLSHLEYIHSNNYVHCDIKQQNVLVGLGHLKHTTFIINFGIAKEYWDTAPRVHIPFHQNQCLTGTPAFASINNHLGVDLGRCDDLESLTYMLIYLLHGSLPWSTSDHEKLSSSSILECKVNTTIKVLCGGIPVKFASVLIYMCSLAFSEDPDYEHLCLLLCGLQATLAVPSACSLDLSMPDNHITHHPPISNEHWMAEAAPCLPDVTPLCRYTRVVQVYNVFLIVIDSWNEVTVKPPTVTTMVHGKPFANGTSEYTSYGIGNPLIG
ncbi:kinase-like domain-containing protein [Suillus lakei]|nr:kinase-like domain-containing protein [Suillus lakei]